MPHAAVTSVYVFIKVVVMNPPILDSEDEIPRVGTVQLKSGRLTQLVDCINY